jgi:hypothetical protein
MHLHGRVLGATLAAVALLATTMPAAAAQDPLAVPTGHVLVFQSEAVGVQIYVCQARADTPGAFEWAFRAPEADLLNDRGEQIGKHYVGPTWEGNDGSQVVGMVAAMANSPSPDAIPWLLLQARSNQGTGVFSTVTYIQRLNTVGGRVPTDGCDGTRTGQEIRVAYTATYAYYYPSAP